MTQTEKPCGSCEGGVESGGLAIYGEYRQREPPGFLWSILGAVGGPLSYYVGVRLGVLTCIPAVTVTLPVLAGVWSLVVPGLLWLSLDYFFTRSSQSSGDDEGAPADT